MMGTVPHNLNGDGLFLAQSAVGALLKEGSAPVYVGGSSFLVKYSDGFLGDQSAAAWDVVVTILNMQNSPTARAALEASHIKSYIVTIYDNPLSLESGGRAMFGFGIVNINFSDLSRKYKTINGDYVNFNIQHIVNHEIMHPATGLDDTPEFIGIVNQINQEIMGGPPRLNYTDVKCFLAGTEISLADGSSKPIEDIRLGDEVMAFDARENQGLGPTVPRKVTRLFRNTADVILDLRGVHMTPGHVVLSDHGEWLTISAVLKADRAIVEEREAGPVLIRARTRQPVGSANDIPVTVLFRDKATDRPRNAVVRAGIPAIGHVVDGRQELWTLGRFLKHEGFRLQPDGSLVDVDGKSYQATPWPGTSPFEMDMCLDWIVSLDGVAYVPPAIAELPLEDAKVVNSTSSRPAIGTQGLLNAGKAPLNRHQRRRQSALRLV